MSARPEAVVAAALSLLAQSPPVTYQEMDCQAFIKACVSRAGATLRAAGSNDMYRNAVSWTTTLQNARATGRLIPGCLLFIVRHDGREPAQYKPDGKGNASHVGLYCAAPQAEVVHSSASLGRVAASTLQNAWTHAAWASVIDPQQGGDPMPDTYLYEARVDTNDSGLNFRREPSLTSARVVALPTLPKGAVVRVLSHESDDWALIAYAGLTGYASRAFLTRLAASAGDTPSDGALRQRMLAIYRDFGLALEVDDHG